MLTFALPFLSAIWGNQWTRLIAVAIIAGGFGWLKGWNAYPRVDVAAVVRNAEAGRDAEWSRKLAATEEKARADVDAAIAERDTASSAPVGDASVASLCQHDRDCIAANPGH